jgi:type II secretory pathway component GspD/PulD (secretin)
MSFISPIAALTFVVVVPGTAYINRMPPKLAFINVAAADGTTTITIAGTASFVPRVSAKPGKKPVILVPLVRTKAAANSIPVASHEITRIDTVTRGKSAMALTVNAPGALVWKISPDAKKQTWTIAFQAKNVASQPLVAAQKSPVLPRRSPLQLASLDAPAIPATPVVKPSTAKRPSTVSLDFTATEVADILKALSIQSGINIVAGAGASGKVTVTLRGVSVTDALDWVTRLAGLRYAQVGETYVVGNGKELAALTRINTPGVIASATESFVYADGQSLVDAIKLHFPAVTAALITAGGAKAGAAGGSGAGGAGLGASGSGSGGGSGQQITPDQLAAGGTNELPVRGGVIYIVGPEDDVAKARQLVASTDENLLKATEADRVRRVDRVTRQASAVLETRFINAQQLADLIKEQLPSLLVHIGPRNRTVGSNNGQSVTFGMPSQTGTQGSNTTGATSGQSTSTGTNGGASQSVDPSVVVILGPDEDIAKAKALRDKLDVRPVQFVYEAEIYDVNSDEVDKLGLTYDFSQVVKMGEANPAADSPTLGADNLAAKNINFGGLFRTPAVIGAQLQALAKRDRAKVLARPRLSGQDGQGAIAFIGDQFNYVVIINQTPLGQIVVTNTATVGITLKVTGQSNGDGLITLAVHPEVSTITSFLTVGTFALPQTSTRFVDTVLRVKDGEQIAIGGLVRSEEFRNRQMVPFLSRLPVIGALFQSDSKQRRNSEVIVLLTARQLKD